MDKANRASALQTLAYVLAWIVAVGLLIGDLMIVRGLVLDLFTMGGLLWASLNAAQWRASRLTYGWVKATANYVYLLVAGCTGLGAAIAVEYYFRKGMPEGLLAQRVRRVIGTELIVGFASWLLSALVTWITVRLPAA